MNPRLSPAATVVLPSFSPTSKPSATASSLDFSARTTSIRGITCGVEEVQADHSLGALCRVSLSGDRER